MVVGLAEEVDEQFCIKDREVLAEIGEIPQTEACKD